MSQISQIRQSGVVDLVAYLNSSSDNVRQLFESECSVLLECRVCKSIFRSFVNFCSHKRGYCRNEVREISDMNTGNSGDASPAKKPVSLRRMNLTRHVSRKVELSEVPVCTEDLSMVTSFVHTLPSFRRRLVAVVGADGSTQAHIPPCDNVPETLPPERVLMLQPQEYPTRHPGMSLRMRLKSDNTRLISKEEMECVERLVKYFNDAVDPTLRRCLYSSCSDISPFGSIWALAYHMSVKHSKKEELTNAIPCLICSKKFTTWDYFHSHVSIKHKQIKLDHQSQRRKAAEEVINKRRARRVRTVRQTTSVVSRVSRCRSLSPEPNQTDEGQPKTVDTQEFETLNSLVSVKVKDEQLEVNEKPPASTDSVECNNVCSLNEDTATGEHAGSSSFKYRRIRRSVIRSGDDRQLSVPSSRERRKRKIPVRYRDATPHVEHEILVESSESSGLVTYPSQETSTVPPTICEDSIIKDVTSVVHFLVSSVVESYQEGVTDSLTVTNVRSRSSRLRKRPDWMDNEDFVIVEDRKCRRDGASDSSIIPVFSQGDSTSSNSHTSITEPSSANQCSSSDVANRTQNVSTHTRRTTPNSVDHAGAPSRRRKQNLNALSDDTEDSVTILSKNGKPGKVDDLAMVPVYLSGAQKQLFFSSLKQLDPNEPDGKHICSQCNEVVPNLKEGRRHMVTHIRVMRLRCSLCGAGSFFCTDLRAHLMEGYCEKLHRAPDGVVKENCTPCMTREQADSLCELVDPVNPGRVMYTSGKIVSAKSRKSYYPDPVIEERILGPGRVFRRSSPTRLKGGRV
ncbi:hypothetical protein KIN20_022843 [Parelaphostrongylus tenuis]|uniref:C2H2-type domain-containing protein n=1 Tax=Parelaphostrongylus tenuis TaxID=148309 RepID=A0AAD5MW23_PARTN|nr:hypothetical protein KIN20_022843 [Parelaphostrongylus tenuis]